MYTISNILRLHVLAYMLANETNLQRNPNENFLYQEGLSVGSTCAEIYPV